MSTHSPKTHSPIPRRVAHLLITMGDPAGIGPEVLLRSLARLPSDVRLRVIGDLGLLRSLARKLRLQVPWARYDWLDLRHPSSGCAAYAYLVEAVHLLKEGAAEGLVTGPVSKEAIARSGIPWRGHTEFLAEQFHCRTVMMFVTGRFRVSLVTTHWALREDRKSVV